MENRSKEQTITIFDVLIALAKKKWFIIIFTGIFSVAAVVYVLVTPEIWRAQSSFVTISDDMSAKGLSASMLGGLGLDFLGGAGSAQALTNAMFLDSRDFKKKAVDEFKLIDYFEVTDPDPLKAKETAIKSFDEKIYSIFFDKETDAITITALSEDKDLSKRIVEYALNELQDYNKVTKKTKGRLKREFLEKRVEEIDTEFNSLTSQLVDFQETSKMFEADTQVKQTISMYADLQAKQIETEVQLNVGEELYGSSNPELAALRSKNNEMKRVLFNLENNDKISDYMIPLKDLPKTSVDYLSLKMKLEINRKIYEYLYPQYELAKIDEIKDMPTIEIINSPDYEGLRIKPKRAMTCVLVFLAAFFMSSFISIFIEFTSDENTQKIVTAYKIFFNKK
jgi:uncharacterized protein involved in exopolysaccharide biosynthesis